MTAYILTAEAEADLRGIIRYTRREWGAAQVRRYIAKLEQGIARLAAGEGPFKDMSELFPALRMARCVNTTTFFACRVRANPRWSWRSCMSAWTS